MRRSVDPAHLPPATGFDAAIIEVESDAADALAAQHPGGRLLDQLLLGWLKLLADDAPPALAALPVAHARRRTRRDHGVRQFEIEGGLQSGTMPPVSCPASMRSPAAIKSSPRRAGLATMRR